MKKPLIGVLPLYDEERESLWMLPGYFDGIRAAGGIPVMLPLEAEKEAIRQLVGLCGGLLFTGGHDVDPALYGAERQTVCGPSCPARDRLEREAFSLAWEQDLPVLGICRGIQLINVLLGGTLYQDLPAEHPGGVEHHMAPPYDRACHSVELSAGGPLAALLGRERLEVNSYHHQAVRDLAPALRPMAKAPDDLVEAVWAPEKRFVWAVQWHPEFSFRTDAASLRLFEAFVEHCSPAA